MLGGDVELAPARLADDVVVEAEQVVAQLGELLLVGLVRTRGWAILLRADYRKF
jgi:hypothetical protein